MNKLKSFCIKGKKILWNIVQGGMGIGISRYPLAKAVAIEGCFGTLSSAGLDKLASSETGRKMNIFEAIIREVDLAKKGGGYVGINIMMAVARDFIDSVKAALSAKIDAIVVGAGLPLSLPSIQLPKETALIPIVSSARALENICKRWERFKYRPDAVVLEGPLAGGHLGFKFLEINSKEFILEKLFPPVKEVAMKYGDFPVIVAGGLYYHEHLLRWQELGADGFQLGTRFLATKESSASQRFKNAVIDCQKQDIVVCDSKNNPPGSPCGLPFRIIRQSPMFQGGFSREPFCSEGYVMQKDASGSYTICPAKYDSKEVFCICRALLAAAGHKEDEMPMWTVGANASRVKEILPVKELLDRLKGLKPDS